MLSLTLARVLVEPCASGVWCASVHVTRKYVRENVNFNHCFQELWCVGNMVMWRVWLKRHMNQLSTSMSYRELNNNRKFYLAHNYKLSIGLLKEHLCCTPTAISHINAFSKFVVFGRSLESLYEIVLGIIVLGIHLAQVRVWTERSTQHSRAIRCCLSVICRCTLFRVDFFHFVRWASEVKLSLQRPHPNRAPLRFHQCQFHL